MYFPFCIFHCIFFISIFEEKNRVVGGLVPTEVQFFIFIFFALFLIFYIFAFAVCAFGAVGPFIMIKFLYFLYSIFLHLVHDDRVVGGLVPAERAIKGT